MVFHRAICLEVVFYLPVSKALFSAGGANWSPGSVVLTDRESECKLKFQIDELGVTP